MPERRSKAEIAKDTKRKFDRAVSNRGTLESHWEEIARRVLPSYAGSFTNKGVTTEGEKRTEDMIDATAALALPKFAAAMESMLTPRNQTWHRLQPMDKSLMRNRTVRMYYDDVTEILFRYRYAPRANYASQQHETYMGLGAFGTGAMYVDQLKWFNERGLRYRAIHLSEIVFLANHQGIIDTALRRFELTARQAVQKFSRPDGSTDLPKKITDANADEKKCDDKFWFIHCVEPRTEEDGYDPQRVDIEGMRFASRYVSEEECTIVEEGGHNTFPYPISRYVVAPGEIYGRSPAMLALPSIKVLNEEKKTVLEQGHRTVRPVLLAHDDGVLDSFSMKPGAMNYGGVSAEGRQLVHALPVGNIMIGKDLMDDERLVINDAFLVTLFQLLTETPQMTATEVLEKVREKGALLSPTMGRQQSEFLGPMIEREIDVLSMQGLLPQKPPILREFEAEYETIYDSPLSRAQRAENASGFMRWIGNAMEYVKMTGDARPLDWANWDSAQPELADVMAVPARWVNGIDQVLQLRAARDEAANAQQMIEAAPAVAGVAKAVQGA
ncbi:MAG: head-tail connector protein [Alphaproteobacteria bacterium]|nr:head-tail connector protein [Alphaproteobacteria bacterium]